MTDIIPIYNGDHDLSGLGYIIAGEEDRGIQIKRMFTHEKIQALKKEVELYAKENSVTKEEAIMNVVRRMK